MALFRSILFALVFYSGSAAIVISGMVIALIDKRTVRGTVRRWALFYRWCAAAILGIRSLVEGTVPRGSVLVAAKHPSMYETIDILLLLDDPVVVMKKNLVDTPGWGRLATDYGIIPIDRGGGATALRAMIAAGRNAVASGRPVAIFPEGSRVPPGERPPLQSGFAGLYRMLGLPVVPMATDAGLVWTKNFVKRPGTIRFRFGEPIPPGLPRAEIEARVHAAINAFEQPVEVHSSPA